MLRLKVSGVDSVTIKRIVGMVESSLRNSGRTNFTPNQKRQLCFRA